MPHTVTLRDLEALGACPEQVAIFAATFPDGITITPDNAAAVALVMVEVGFDASWYAYHALLDDEWGDYNAVVDPAWAAYYAAITPVWAAYHAAVVTLPAACEAEAAARIPYCSAMAEAICSILASRP